LAVTLLGDALDRADDAFAELLVRLPVLPAFVPV
jgi:hypothetical protein